jgi:hypothetical protein
MVTFISWRCAKRQSLRVGLLSCVLILVSCTLPIAADAQVVISGKERNKTRGKPGSVSPAEKEAIAWVDPCPASSVNAPEGKLIDAGEAGIGMYQNFECNPGSGWTTIFVCSQRCPEGAVREFIPPVPPAVWRVIASLRKSAPLPDPKFAPPVELGGGRAAIVGKRLYVNLTEASFSETDRVYFWNTEGDLIIKGYWYARVLFVPVDYEFAGAGATAGPCTGPGLSGRTLEGRQAQDAQKCSLIINDRPPSGVMTVKVKTNWRAIVVTNIPGMSRTVLLDSEIEVPIPVKELQVVVVD